MREYHEKYLRKYHGYHSDDEDDERYLRKRRSYKKNFDFDFSDDEDEKYYKKKPSRRHTRKLKSDEKDELSTLDEQVEGIEEKLKGSLKK